MCGKQQETVRENTGKKNAQNTQNTNKTHTHKNKAEGQHTQGVPRQFEAVVRAAREGDGRCVQSGHHNDHHCHETRALAPSVSPPFYQPSAISLTLQTFIINTHTHTHIPAYAELLFWQCLPLALLSHFLCFSFGAFFLLWFGKIIIF